MSLNVEIKVDAPGAAQTVASVQAPMEKLEAQGAKTGDALSKGLGAGAPAAEKTKKSTDSATEALAKMANAGNAFAGITAHFQRQADLLEKLRGPAREYATDLQALDEMLERGAITAGEYARGVTDLNETLGDGVEKTEEAKGATERLGEAFEALKLPAVGVGLLEVGRKLAELAAEAERAQDEYTNLTNKALKFEDANHGQKQIIDDMGVLADSLHTTREKAFELYDTVRDGTDGMRVSYDDQAKMAKEFGLANELAGNGVDQAADSLKRFMYDVASGTVDVRAIKQQMIEVPEIADVWTGAFHTTRAGLLSMLDSGKVGIRDLALALTRPSDALDEMNKKATKIADTNAQMMKKWAEDVNVDVQRGMSGIQAIQMKQLGKNSLYTQIQESDGFGGLVTNNDEADLARGKAALAKFNEEAKTLTGTFGSMGDAWDKAMGKVLTAATEAPELLKKTETAIGGIVAKLDDMAMHGTDAWSQIDTAFGRGVKDSQEYSQKIGDAKKGLEALRLEVAAHAIGADDARKKYEGLMTTLNDGRLPAAIKEFDAIHEPARTFREDLAALNGMLAEGVIQWDEYDQQMQKVQSEAVDPMVKLLDRINAPMEEQTRGLALAAQAYSVGTITLEQYNNELDRLYKLTNLEHDARSQTTPLGPADFASVPTPQSYAHGLGTKAYEANQNYYSKAEKQQYDEFEKGATDAISGVDRGLKQLRDNTLDIGKTMTEEITGAFGKMNDSIVAMVTTGKADFGQLATFIEQALAKIALQEIEIGLISAFGGGGAGAVAKIAGSWAGSDTTIPHAANGYAGKVAGVGGVDTRLFAAMVSPGETVSIRTPEQNAAAQRSSSSTPTVNIHDHSDVRGQLAAGISNGSLDVHLNAWARRNRGLVQSLIKT